MKRVVVSQWDCLRDGGRCRIVSVDEETFELEGEGADGWFVVPCDDAPLIQIVYLNPLLRVFRQSEAGGLPAALDFAARGGVAIYLHRLVDQAWPVEFRICVADGQHVAHVFDRHEDRVRVMATGIGVDAPIDVKRQGTRGQHINVCGQPLRRLLAAIGDE